MIIKEAEGRETDVAALQALMSHPDATAATRKKIEQEIRFIQAGAMGEKEVAYEIDFHFRDNKNHAVLHDLRIECGDRVAQIDHLIINRMMLVWVIESKRFSEGIRINERGECDMFWRGRPVGIGSPYEQNLKHVDVLRGLMKEEIKMPRRLGIAINASFESLVAVSKSARVQRPKSEGWWSTGLAKSDQFLRLAQDRLDGMSAIKVLSLAPKVVSSETLRDVASQLAAKHRPIQFDWHAKFGLSKSAVEVVSAAEASPMMGAPDEAKTDAKPSKTKHSCADCSAGISYAVARYCRANKERFGDGVYCMDCQKRR